MKWFSISAIIQSLFRSRYVASLEDEIERLRVENATLLKIEQQVLSNLLQGASMPGLDLEEPKPSPIKPKRMVPSLWRKHMEEQDRQIAQELESKQKN